MNFLELCQRLRRKTRSSGNGPTTVVGSQIEDYARLIAFINEAWVDLQTMRQDWLWMRSSTTFTTTASQAVYTIAQIGLTDFGNWKINSFRNYDTTAGTVSEITMETIPYDDWRNTYYLGATRFTQTRPVQCAIAPDLSVALGPVPADGYTVSAEYCKVPYELAVDADIPQLPIQYHMIIVYRAMMYYGASEGAPEIYQEGEVEYRKMLNRLSMQQLTDSNLAGALA
jgi:hypothetical protein